MVEVNIGGDFNLPQLATGRGLLEGAFADFLDRRGLGPKPQRWLIPQPLSGNPHFSHSTGCSAIYRRYRCAVRRPKKKPGRERPGKSNREALRLGDVPGGKTRDNTT
jgi:hypothetical protein